MDEVQCKGHTEIHAWFSKSDHEDAGMSVPPHDLFTMKQDIIGEGGAHVVDARPKEETT